MNQHPGERDLAALIPAWSERENLVLLLPVLHAFDAVICSEAIEQ